MRAPRAATAATLSLVAALVALTGCNIVTGLGDYSVSGTGAGTGSGTTSSTGAGGGAGGTGGGAACQVVVVPVPSDADVSSLLPSINGGGAPTIVVQNSGGGTVHALFHLGLFGLSGAASASFCVHHAIGGAGSAVVAAYSVSREWMDGAVTWERPNVGQLWTTAGGDYFQPPLDSVTVDASAPDGTEVCWDVTDHLVTFTTGSDFGVLLAITSPDPLRAVFHSSDAVNPAARPRTRVCP